MTQKEKVLRILKVDKKISRNYCVNERISLRLSAIIFELKKEGHRIFGLHEKGDFIYYLDD